MKKPHAKAVQKASPQFPVSPEDVKQALEKDEVLSDVVSKMLEPKLPRKKAEQLIGEITNTAYRRVHEVLASTLDRLYTLLYEFSRTKREEFLRNQLPHMLIDLNRCLVLIEYQEARKQLSEEFCKILYTIIRSVRDKMRPGTGDSIDVTTLIHIVTRARILLDALAVLVYRYRQ